MHPSPCPWQAGARREPVGSSSSRSLPSTPLCRRGSTPCPLLCLALGVFEVLSGRKQSAGDAAKEEEERKSSSYLVFIWPCGSCILTFCSRREGEHSWQSCFVQLCPSNTCPAPSSPLPLLQLHCQAVLAVPSSVEAFPRLAAEGRAGLGLTQLFLCPFPMHILPEGVQGAQVTQLPSIKPVLKELSGRRAVTTLDTSSLEKLLQHQAQVRLSCSAISPISTSHTWPGADAACQGPGLLWACLVSAANSPAVEVDMVTWMTRRWPWVRSAWETCVDNSDFINAVLLFRLGGQQVTRDQPSPTLVLAVPAP
ncbi:uncharacterized protein LOC136013744 isoform X2 [Lathamus discolor]|uniref:uncharacterized protein LOC136013744 isoform X2 n=1 Tax=Lathamus discolor TaxID=678569 RepID=UPI0032B7D01D